MFGRRPAFNFEDVKWPFSLEPLRKPLGFLKNLFQSVGSVRKNRWVFSAYPLKALRKAVRNIASSLKFELISWKIGLFFYVMELDTHELFRCLARDCNYRDEKLCDVSKADCIARDYILFSIF